MDNFINFIRNHTQWLYFKIFDTSVIQVDLWSLVHIWLGIIIFTILSRLNVRNLFLKLLIILLVCKTFGTLILTPLGIFCRESMIDSIGDLIFGMIGGFIIYLLLERPIYNRYSLKRRSVAILFSIIFTSVTVAFSWVGFYRYKYNDALFNSAGLSWWSFFLWTMGGIGIISIYVYLDRFIKSGLLRSIIVWIIYFPSLIVVEYLGWAVFQIREIGHELTPLIGNLIHGTQIMHIFYTCAPFIIIMIFCLISGIFRHYLER